MPTVAEVRARFQSAGRPAPRGDLGGARCPAGLFFDTGTPNNTESRLQACDLTRLAAAHAASEAASELVRATREGTPVAVDGVLPRLVDAARAVAELEPKPENAELLVAILRWNAEQV